MRGKIYSNKIKKEAEILRLKGKTYKEIKEKLNVPKSTLSTWLAKRLNIPFNKSAQLAHLKKIRPLAIEAKRKEKEKQLRIIKEKINKEIITFPMNNLGFYKSILSILYWAEGAKHEKVSGVRFANTDPKLAQLYITLLRKCYDIDEKKFRLRLHIHYYHRTKTVKKFWLRILNIPESQFTSVYIKKRSRAKRFRKNFMGICFINYLDSSIRKEILELGYRLQELII